MHTPETLYLIDGHGQIFRAYFAIRGGMNSPITGEPTNASFAFASMLLKFLALRPAYAVMAIDTPGKTFRDDLYPEYKANRPPPPADLLAQEPRIFDMTRMFGIPILGQSGAEADDIIATLTQRVLDDGRCADLAVRIVSKDKDLEQLLGARVTLFDIHTDATLDEAGLKASKGISPAQVVDMLALMGDAVDNVPGVEGIGPKTAAQLIHEFGSVDGIYANLDKIKGKRRENLEKARELLPLSQKLVLLKRDLTLDFDLAQARLGPMDGAGLRNVFDTLGFRRLKADLEKVLAGEGEAPFPGAAGSSDGKKGSDPLIASATPGTGSAGASPSRMPIPEKRTQNTFDFAGSLFDTGAPGVSTELAPGITTGWTPAPPPPGATTAAMGDYRAITTRAELYDLLATLRGQPLFALDTETIGLGHRAEPCGMSLAWQPGQAVYIPFRSPDPTAHLDAPTVLQTLRPVLEDPAIGKCGHNLKYDLLVLRHAGAKVTGVAFDSMIASHLLGAPAHGLDHLALAQLHHHMMQIHELIGPPPVGRAASGGGTAKQRTMDQAPLDLITRYAADDAEVSLRLCHALRPQLKVMGLEDLSEKVEMPLVEVLAEMEFWGIRVDPAVLEEQKKALAGRIEVLRDQIHQHVGVPFNIDSPKQLAEVFFKRLGLPVQKRTKTGLSTDIEVLEQLADLEGLTHEQAAVPGLIVEYRQLTKLVGTYLDALRDSIHPATGRVHAQFHQSGAATGRLSSSDPNLQNIPIRTEVGRQIRRAFIADPGSLLISADYSQIELRVLAHLSGDANLIEAFEKDQDIHAAVAAQVFNTPLDQVTREQRGHAKVINFGIVYGVTPYGLARRIEGLDVERATKLIRDYKMRFAGIGAFLDRCIQQAEELGYVTTMMGRRRPIQQIRSANRNQRSLGERLAINSVVQGSAADLIKLSMVNLHRRIERERLPLKLLLQIHDELVLEAPAEAAAAMAQVVRTEMETAMTLRMPLKVEAATGPDWLAAK